jgi:hypothetical protein
MRLEVFREAERHRMGAEAEGIYIKNDAAI